MKIFRKNILPAVFAAALVLMTAAPAAAAAGDAAYVSDGASQTGYASASEAYNKAVSLAKSGKTVTLTLGSDWIAGEKGLGTDGYLNVPSGVSLTVDLNGCIIDRGLKKATGSGSVFVLQPGAKLTVKDSNSGKAHSGISVKGGIITGGASTSKGGAFYLDKDSSLTLSGGCISGCVSTDLGGGIYLDEGARLTASDTLFLSDRTYDSSGECLGGAIYCDEGEMMLTGCIFEGNYAEDDGGAVYIDDSHAVMTNCAFCGNKALEEGGAVFFDTDKAVRFTGCVFRDNRSEEDGGAVYAEDCSSTIFRDSVMTGNSTAGKGGAVCVNCDRFDVYGGTITGNTAGKHGGGIYVDSLCDINVCGKLVIENNTAGGRKSDLCLQDGSASDAYIICGGFDEGSHVGIDTTDGEAVMVCKEISFFQFRYLFGDNAKLSFDKNTVVKEKFISSAVGHGRHKIPFICTVAAFIAFAVVLPLVIKKRNGGRADEKDSK